MLSLFNFNINSASPILFFEVRTFEASTKPSLITILAPSQRRQSSPYRQPVFRNNLSPHFEKKTLQVLLDRRGRLPAIIYRPALAARRPQSPPGSAPAGLSYQSPPKFTKSPPPLSELTKQFKSGLPLGRHPPPPFHQSSLGDGRFLH